VSVWIHCDYHDAGGDCEAQVEAYPDIDAHTLDYEDEQEGWVYDHGEHLCPNHSPYELDFRYMEQRNNPNYRTRSWIGTAVQSIWEGHVRREEELVNRILNRNLSQVLDIEGYPKVKGVVKFKYE